MNLIMYSQYKNRPSGEWWRYLQETFVLPNCFDNLRLEDLQVVLPYLHQPKT